MSDDPLPAPRRSIATNSMFSVIAWLFPILFGFITTPILVRNLGGEQYGLFALVLGFISYSFTFGVGKVAGKYVPEFRAANQPEKVTQAISATFWFSLTIGAAGSIVLVLVTPVLVRRVLRVPEANEQIAIVALYLAAAIGLAIMVSQVFQYVVQGLHRFDNYVTLTNLNSLLLGSGNIFLALNGYGVVAILGWNLGVTALTGTLFYLRARHLLPTMRLVPRFDRDMALRVSSYAGNIILFQIFANVLFIFERGWVMRRFGADQLTFYFVPMLLAIYVHGFVSSIVQAMFPVVNEMIDDIPRILSLYQRANKIILLIVMFAVTNFFTCGGLFLQFWVSPEVAAESYTLLIPHGLTFGLIALAIMALLLAEVFRFPALNVIMTGSWMLIAVPLMIVFSDLWQAEGVAWGRFAGALVTFPVVAYAERRFLGKIQWRFWAATASRVTLAVVSMAAVQILILRTMSTSILSLIVAGMIGLGAFGSVLMITGFLTREDKLRLRHLVSRRRGI